MNAKLIKQIEIQQMRTSISLLILFCSVFLCFRSSLCSDATGDYFRFSCTNNGNFTNSSTYGTNLNLLFSQLSTSSDLNYGFYNRSVGRSPDQVNVVGLCRGDQENVDCRRCLDETVSELQKSCPNYKEAVGWWELCSLRFSSQRILGVMATSPYTIHLNKNLASKVDRFNQVLSTLLNSLSSRAAGEGSHLKYAADNATDPGLLERIYALVQCTPDLSRQQCGDCLEKAIESINPRCYGTIGCRVLQPSCNLRYETKPFFVALDIPQLSPPLPQAQPPPPPPPSSTDSSGKMEGNGSSRTRTTIIAFVAAAAGVVVLPLCFWICLRLRRPKRDVEIGTTVPEAEDEIIPEEKDDEFIKVESLQYDFAIVQKATNDFSNENKLGQGGFGVVYKGRFLDGQEVAVKRLSRGSKQGEKEFMNEVKLVAKLQHRNLVRLVGFSLKGKERLLIYEFVPNASLDRFIFDPNKSFELNWERRYRIIVGIARGLLYIHEDSRDRIVHRDLKASNVLLDEQMNPKIADFGMARLFQTDESHDSTRIIAGTIGYMAPEYVVDGRISVKSDVYSFGVLLLEIISGQRCTYLQDEENVEGLVARVWKHWREGTVLNIIDSTLRSNDQKINDEIMICIHIGLLCVQDFADRPTMADVCHGLSGNSTALPTPSEPTYFAHRHNVAESVTSQTRSSESNTNGSKDELLSLSKNDVTITELYPR